MATATVKGFVVRAATPRERDGVLPWFIDSALSLSHAHFYIASGQPGDILLGAIAVCPSPNGQVGYIEVFVLPECRRRGIGRRLFDAAYKLALNSNTHRLVYARLLSATSPENAFYRMVGLEPESTLGTYTVELDHGIRHVCEPALARSGSFCRSPVEVAMVSLGSVDASCVAQFTSRHYSGFVDHQIRRMNDGYFDPSISQIAVLNDGQVVGVALARSKPGVLSMFLDLLLVAQDRRRGPLALSMLTAVGRASLSTGATHCVFEADSKHDSFAVGFARRCGATASNFRYRYAIDHEGVLRYIRNQLVVSRLPTA